MLIKRVSKHLVAQNWVAVIIDIMVVVVGIYLGLQAADWSEARNKQKSEIRYLKALNYDLQRLDDIFEDKILFETSKAKLTNYVYGLLKEDDLHNSKKQIVTSLTDLTSRRTSNFSSPVYIDLLSSGKLTLIRDERLRNEIIAFFSEMEHRSLILEKNSKHFVDEAYLPIIQKYFSSRLDVSILPEEYQYILDFGNVNDIVTTDILVQQDITLELPNDDLIWQEVRRALSWRIFIALGSRATVKSLRQDRIELSEKISIYLQTLE